MPSLAVHASIAACCLRLRHPSMHVMHRRIGNTALLLRWLLLLLLPPHRLCRGRSNCSCRRLCCTVLLRILLLRRWRPRMHVVVLRSSCSRGGGTGRGLAIQRWVPAEQLRELGSAAAQRVAGERPALQVGRCYCPVGVHARVAGLHHHVGGGRHKAQRPLPRVALRQPEADGDVVLHALG